MGWKPALRSEFVAFLAVCILGGWVSFAHSLWTTCINELYEPFSYIEHLLEHLCVIVLQGFGTYEPESSSAIALSLCIDQMGKT